MQCSAKLPPNHCDDERANRRGYAAEERSGAPGEVEVVHPAGVNHRPIKMILHHLLEGPGNGALLGQKSTIEIDVVFPLQVPSDEGRIRNDFAAVIDVRELALGCFLKPVVSLR